MNKLTKSMIMGAVLCGSLGMMTTASAAEPVEFFLDDVVVTATRTEANLIDVPANVSVVDAETIANRNYQSVERILNDVPGVNVKKNGYAGGKSAVSVNGESRVLILVDGRRVNRDMGIAEGRSGFDMSNMPAPEFIERVEVVKGAGSALYGSDAVGGVINIITKNAEKNYVKVGAATGNWGARQYNAAVSAKEGKTGIFATYSKEEQDYVKYKDNVSDDKVRFPNSSLNDESVTVKLDQEIGDDQMATIYFSHDYKKADRPNVAPFTTGMYGTLTSLAAHSKDLNNNVSAKYTWNMDSDNSGYVQIYRNHYVGNFYDSENPFNEGKFTETKDGIDLQQNFRLSDNNLLTAGAEWRESEVENVPKYAGSKKINDKALFVQDSWDFAEDWTLNGGVRYDKHNYFGDKTTGSVALNKVFGDTGHAYVSWGQVFNAPQGDDMFHSFGGNPDLKPEKGDVWNIGFDTAVGDKDTVGINAFYSKLDDAIAWAPDASGNNWSPMNVDKQKNRGIEVHASHDFDENWAAHASYAYLKVEKNANSMGYVRDLETPTNTYKLGFSYTDEKFTAEVFGRAANGLNTKKYADHRYFTMDMSLSYRPVENLKVFMNVDNLNNAAFAEHAGLSTDGSGRYLYPAAGRFFLVGTEYTF